MYAQEQLVKSLNKVISNKSMALTIKKKVKKLKESGVKNHTNDRVIPIKERLRPRIFISQKDMIRQMQN